MRKIIPLLIVLLLIPSSASRAWIFTVMSGGAAPYTVGYSCRFNDDDSAYLSRTPGEAGDDKTWSLSFWTKRSYIGDTQMPLFGHFTDGSNYTRIFFQFDNFYMYTEDAGVKFSYITTQKFRDPSQWYHFLIVFDSTEAVQADRIKAYVNGVEITSWSTSTNNIALNDEYFINNAVSHAFGGDDVGSGYDGYLAEGVLIDGQQLTASSFGETSATTGQWVPIEYTGTYGTNGSHLDFANSAALGTDVSGQGNNWTPSGLAATDQMLDTPTNNWAVVNVLDNNASTFTLSEGNLKVTYPTATDYESVRSSVFVNSGKWYVELYNNVDASDEAMPGILQSDDGLDSYLGRGGIGYYAGTGQIYNADVTTAYGNAFTAGDLIGIALDMDNGKLFFSKNGVWQNSGDPAAGTNPAASGISGWWAFGTSGYTTNDAQSFNFGQDSTNVATPQSDDNGYGTFEYDPPTGFLALCSANLPAPVTNLPTNAFNVLTRTGTGGTVNITSLSFSPDILWIKNRDQADSHHLHDIGQAGVDYYTTPDTAAVSTQNVNSVTSFDANGYTLGTGANGWNDNTEKFVDWAWLESATYGIDIVTYTGTGANRTINHSLGVVPDVIILNPLWVENKAVYHAKMSATPQTSYMYLDVIAGDGGPNVSMWNSTAPTSSVFSLGTAVVTNKLNENYVAYLFAGKEGFSKFGSYTGNGNADGPFVYTGFKPAFIMMKIASVASTTYGWQLYDSERSPFNVVALPGLWASEPVAEVAATYNIDLLSNGFKLRANNPNNNNLGQTHIYFAFAERPFKYGDAR